MCPQKPWCAAVPQILPSPFTSLAMAKCGWNLCSLFSNQTVIAQHGIEYNKCAQEGKHMPQMTAMQKYKHTKPPTSHLQANQLHNIANKINCSISHITKKVHCNIYIFFNQIGLLFTLLHPPAAHISCLANLASNIATLKLIFLHKQKLFQRKPCCITK